MNEERRIENIPIEKIIPNIYQPRINFNENKLNELSKAIKEYGIIQPIILRKVGETYEIIDGERRFRAANKIGIKTVPAIVLDIDEKQAAELLLTENMQKQLLTPIEEANSYQQIMLLNKINIDELSIKLGKDKVYLENKLNLLNLPLEIQEALLNNKISEGHARLLLKIPSKAKKIELYRKIINERLTVKTLEEIINNSTEEKNQDIVNIEELNKEEFLKEQKKNKMEEQSMKKNQMNFNQYNNLIKEQQTKMMESNQMEPILGNQQAEKNEFFPSLEEQPLNMNIPELEKNEVSNPSFEMPNQFVQEPQTAAPMPSFDASQAPMMNEPMGMPQFEMPNQFVQEPQTAAPMPSFDAPQAPMMNEPMGMPQFEMPNQFMQEPQMAAPMPSFDAPQAPMMNEPMGMPQFEIPNQFVQEPQMAAPMPSFDAPQAPMMTDVMPAVNMVRNLIPLLENSGYKIVLEELDNPTEYNVIIKVQK